MAGGLLMGLIHAVASIRYRANQIVVGVAINLLVVGLTRFFLHLAFDSSSNSPRVPGFGGTDTSSAVLASIANPLVWFGSITMVLVAWLLYRTPFGLRVRAAGEKPEAAVSLGVPVKRVRWLAVAVSGMCAALAGAYLALDQHQFTDGMTAGRGFIALAAVIFGKWDPKRVTIACLLFAAAETMQIRLQSLQLVPSQFVEMIPYVLTIVALAGVVGRAVQPAALGKAVD
jgi:simple sugar transport system permease protein